MQGRQEFTQIVGYRSRSNLILAHTQSAISAAFISMQACRYFFGWLANPYNDFYLREIAILSAINLIVHILNNYAIESLNTLENEVRQLSNLRPRVSHAKMCLFSSPNDVYRSHRKTIIDSFVTGAALLKTYQLMTEGIILYNLPYIGISIYLLYLLQKDFTQAYAQNFDSATIKISVFG